MSVYKIKRVEDRCLYIYMYRSVSLFLNEEGGPDQYLCSINEKKTNQCLFFKMKMGD